MSIPTANLGLLKAEGSDVASSYLKTALAAALDNLDSRFSGPGATLGLAHLADDSIPASKLANRTRAIFLGAQEFFVAEGAPTITNVGLNHVAWQLHDGVLESVAAQLLLPYDNSGGNPSLYGYFSEKVAIASPANVCRVFHRSAVTAPAGGTILNGAGVEVNLTLAGAVGRLHLLSLGTLAPGVANSLVGISVGRSGADVNDTHTADIYFHGVLVTYAADS